MTRSWIRLVVCCAASSGCAPSSDDAGASSDTGVSNGSTGAFSSAWTDASAPSGSGSVDATDSDAAASTDGASDSTGESTWGSESGASTGDRGAPEFGSILVAGERSRWIGNSFMALQNLHVEAVVAAHEAFTIETFPRTPATASAENGYAGWFYGQGLWAMDGVVGAIADEGGYDTCVLTSGPWEGGDPSTTDDDAEPLGGLRDFIEALTPWCDRFVLYVTWGYFGMSPTRNPDNYAQGIAEVLRDARRVEATFPDVVTVPLGLVFYELMTDPPVPVPRRDYLHQPGDDSHQNMLGAVIVTWTYYAVVADVSPVGADYDFAAFDPPFVVDERIGLAGRDAPFPEGPGASMPFDAAVRAAFQQRIWDIVQQWRTHTSRFDG